MVSPASQCTSERFDISPHHCCPANYAGQMIEKPSPQTCWTNQIFSLASIWERFSIYCHHGCCDDGGGRLVSESNIPLPASASLKAPSWELVCSSNIGMSCSAKNWFRIYTFYRRSGILLCFHFYVFLQNLWLFWYTLKSVLKHPCHENEKICFWFGKNVHIVLLKIIFNLYVQ